MEESKIYLHHRFNFLVQFLRSVHFFCITVICIYKWLSHSFVHVQLLSGCLCCHFQFLQKFLVRVEPNKFILSFTSRTGSFSCIRYSSLISFSICLFVLSFYLHLMLNSFGVDLPDPSKCFIPIMA